jgi:hypothetical protein
MKSMCASPLVIRAKREYKPYARRAAYNTADNQAGCHERLDGVIRKEENFTACSAKLADPDTGMAVLEGQGSFQWRGIFPA